MWISFNAAAGGKFSSSTLELVHGTFKNYPVNKHGLI
jgi:hypothetical protein